ISRELADGEERPVERDGRDDSVDSRAVGKARIDKGAGFVNASTDPADNTVDDPAEMCLIAELRIDRVDLAVPLDVDTARTVHHDFRDLRVTEEWLNGSMPEDLIGDLLGYPSPVGLGERCLLRAHH